MFIASSRRDWSRPIGDAGFKLHTGRSRNDQVALDTRLYLKRAIIHVQVQIRNLSRELVSLAKANRDVVIPGYTHLRKAQPMLFAHYLLAYFEMFQRDYDRLDDCFRRTDAMPLGSGALAGNGFPIDREALRIELGFSQLTREQPGRCQRSGLPGRIRFSGIARHGPSKPAG